MKEISAFALSKRRFVVEEGYGSKWTGFVGPSIFVLDRGLYHQIEDGVGWWLYNRAQHKNILKEIIK